MRRGVLALTVLTLCGFTALAQQTIESVEKEVEQLWAKTNSFTANVTTDTTVAIGPATMKSLATGTMQVLKEGEKSYFKIDMLNKIDTGVPVAGTLEQKILSVFDGKEMFNEMEAMGMKQVYRMSPEDSEKQAPLTGKSMIESLRRQGELKLLPDASVDGKPTYVIEVTPNPETKSAAPSPISIMRTYISKELGLQVKMEVIDEKGAPMSTTVYKDIKINVPLTPAEFAYVVPEGVKVQDMSELKKLQP
ncbi:MAG TPA: hypothetical protein PK869_02040 [Candidatus Hydrogenedentes bacterium]|nr:hypothetical protein [Candidatus Hydrogenedentota bacterium]